MGNISLLLAIAGWIAAFVAGTKTVERKKCHIYAKKMDYRKVAEVASAASFVLGLVLILDLGAEYVSLAAVLLPHLYSAGVALALVVITCLVYIGTLFCFYLSGASIKEGIARIGARKQRAKCRMATRGPAERRKVIDDCLWRNPTYCPAGVSRPVVQFAVSQEEISIVRQILQAQQQPNDEQSQRQSDDEQPREMQMVMLNVEVSPDYSDEMSWRSVRDLNILMDELKKSNGQAG